MTRILLSLLLLGWLASDGAAQSAYKEIDPKATSFSGAASFRKTARLSQDKIEIAKAEQEVVTVIAGKPETKNMAKPGDYIVTGALGERYVIPGNRFDRLYEPDPGRAGEFRSKGTVLAVLLTEPVTFKAPWGEQQRIDAGGVLVKNGDDIYGIAEQAFAETYGRADKEGRVFVALDLPLAQQKAQAHERGESSHVADVDRRMNLKK
ncbi:MAG: hypothetical protein FJX54_10755 [Alphaproteobacteria bacterium]|nr:hypothetical protein [Alphaproteobacteria bacterium]